MTRRDQQMDRLVRDFYSRAPVDPASATRLAALASVDQHPPSGIRRRSQVGIYRALLGLALLITAATASYQYACPLGAANADALPKASAISADARLVALRFQVDWCPFSKATAPVFTDLVMRYGNTPVRFVVYNMTDDAQSAKSEEMAKRMGVDWIRPRPSNSGKVFLVEPNHRRILATLSKPEDRDRWAEALELALVR